MGEAKRRQEKGLPPKSIKKENKDDKPNIFKKISSNQALLLVLAIGFMIFLIIDLVMYYNE